MVAADGVRKASGRVTYHTLECETWWEAGLSLLFPKSFLSNREVTSPRGSQCHSLGYALCSGLASSKDRLTPDSWPMPPFACLGRACYKQAQVEESDAVASGGHCLAGFQYSWLSGVVAAIPS